MPTHRLVFVALAVIAAAACKQKEPEPESRPRPAEPAPARPAPAAASAAKPTAAKLTWPDPQGWVRSPASSPMRLATYRVPRVKNDPEDAELTVFHFGPGQGGTVASNLQRWEMQFQNFKKPAARSQRTVKGMPVHFIQVDEGDFTSASMPGQPGKERKAYGMVAAVVESPGGLYFFKLVGPSKTVAASQKAFDALIDGLAFST